MEILAAVIHDRLHINVKTNARKTEILKIEEGVVHLAVAAPPEDGKANAEIERFLSKLLKRKARIKSGFTSKEKLVVLS
jgi:uncharacterized protein